MQRADDLLPAKFGDGEKVNAALQPFAEATLEVGDTVGGMPFGMQQHREIVQRGDGRQLARQRNEVRLVIQIVAAATGSTTGGCGLNKVCPNEPQARRSVCCRQLGED